MTFNHNLYIDKDYDSSKIKKNSREVTRMV